MKTKMETIDLRPITRASDKLETTVALSRYSLHRDVDWLIFGESSLVKREAHHKWELHARMDATDWDHSSLYAICLPLIGVELTSVDYHYTEVVGWIDPDAVDPLGSRFRVPTSSDYDPTKLEEASLCTRCTDDGEQHIVVPEGHLMPPFDKKLYEQVKGKRVIVTFGPKHD